VVFAVRTPILPPALAESFEVVAPEVAADISVVDFDVFRVDTQYEQSGKEEFRAFYSGYIANLIHEALGSRRVFEQVTREAQPGTRACDYEVSGVYDYFERLGGQGRQYIPFLGVLGAPINRAWVRAALTIQVRDVSTGERVFEQSYPEEHRKSTSMYGQVVVNYLQDDYIAHIAADVIEAIDRAQRSRTYP
jgi:hypothetical protein